MKVLLPDLACAKTFEDLQRFSAIAVNTIGTLLNGQLALDNLSGQILSVVFSAANSDTQVRHSLNRVPLGYWVIRRDGSYVVYDGSLAWDTANIYLKASNTGTAQILVL